jgi:hypothetical protein
MATNDPPGAYVVPRTRTEIVRISQTTPDVHVTHAMRHGEMIEKKIAEQNKIIAERQPDVIPFYVTFGFGQKLQDCYTIVFAKDDIEARNIIGLVYEQLWSLMYADAEGPSGAGIIEHNLKLVPFGSPNWRKSK